METCPSREIPMPGVVLLMVLYLRPDAELKLLQNAVNTLEKALGQWE